MDDERSSSPSLVAKLENFIYRYRRFALVVGLLVCVAVALLGYSGKNAWFWGPPFGVLTGTDFQSVLRGASEMVAGINPYQHALEFARQPSFSELMTWQTSPFVYPPLAAVLARPLLAMPIDAAPKVWTIVNWLLIIGSAWIAVALFGPGRSAGGVLPFAFMLVLFYLYRPVQVELQLAQMDILILFLLLLTYWLYQRGRLSAALPIAFAIALKPLVAPMLIFFVWKRQWRMVALSVVAAGLLTAYGFFVAGWHLLPDYLQFNMQWANSSLLAFPYNQSVYGFTQRLFSSNQYIVPLIDAPLLGRGVMILVGLLAIAAWIKYVSRSDDRAASRNGIEYGFTLTTMALCSPLVEDIHFVWMLVPLSALLLTLLADLRRHKNESLLVICFLVALYLGTPFMHKAIYYGWDSLAQRNTLVAQQYGLLTGAYLYGLIALEICLVWYLVKERRGN